MYRERTTDNKYIEPKGAKVMRKMKLFPCHDPVINRVRSYHELETAITVFLDDNGELVDVKPYGTDPLDFLVIYDEYQEM